MTNFRQWQNEAFMEGTFICMICFDSFPLAESYVDELGDHWDVCPDCGELEAQHQRRTHRQLEMKAENAVSQVARPGEPK